MNHFLFLLTILAAGLMMPACSCNKSDNALDSAVGAESDPAVIAPSDDDSFRPDFIGNYTDSNDGSTLSIGNKTNAGLSVKIELFRLTDIDDGAGTFADGALRFIATDAAGNPIKGKIVCDGDTATLTFTESTWEYLPNGTTYRFTWETATVRILKNSLVGKTFSGSGNGGGLATDVTIKFKSDGICECTSDFYQAFSKPVKVSGSYNVKEGIVEVVCRPDGFETPIDWFFSVRNDGNELSFNSSESETVGSIGNDWLILNKK